jgi:phosphonate transport system permease protein
LIFDPNQNDIFAPLKAAGRLFNQLIHFDSAVLARAIMAMVETVFVAFLATATAIPVAFVLCFLTARNVMGQSLLGAWICSSLRVVFNVSRSVEPVLWAVIFSVWVGIGPFAGMLALMIHSIASLAKQYSEIVESVEEGPIEGIRATGAGELQTIWFAIVPQVVLPFISFTIYRWDINVRMATILGLVGGGGIGKMLIEYQGQAQWHQVGTIILVIAFVVWVMDAFSAHVRSAIK